MDKEENQFIHGLFKLFSFSVFIFLLLFFPVGEPGAFHTLNENRNQDNECLLTYGRETIGLEYAAIAAPKKSLLKPLVDRK